MAEANPQENIPSGDQSLDCSKPMEKDLNQEISEKDPSTEAGQAEVRLVEGAPHRPNQEEVHPEIARQETTPSPNGKDQKTNSKEVESQKETDPKGAVGYTPDENSHLSNLESLNDSSGVPVEHSAESQSQTQATWSSSVSFTEQARNHLNFLKLVYHHPHLNEDIVLHNAVRRYENLWLPLIVKYKDVQLEAPLDIHWIWHCHMLSPTDYTQHCEGIFGIKPSHTLRAINTDEYQYALIETEALWVEHYANEPFEVDYKALISNTDPSNSKIDEKKSDLRNKEYKCQYDLVDATYRQRSFFYQVSLPHFWDEKFLTSAVERYVKFLQLKKANRDIFTVPMYDIDLIWHTHQLHPQFYSEETESVLGYILTHDDKDQDRSSQSNLTLSSNKTKKAWWEMYKSRYAINGTCYRGRALSTNIHRDREGYPTCQSYTLHLESLTITGCQGSDVINAKLCDADGLTLMELPKTQVCDGKFSWTRPGGEIEVTTAGSEKITHVYLYLSNCQGWFSSISPTPLARVYLPVPLKDAILGGQMKVVLESGSMTIQIHFTASVVKQTQVPLLIEWGQLTNETMPESPEDAWGPLNLPPDLKPEGNQPMCGIANHKVTVCGSTLYTVRVIHIYSLGLSFTHVYRGDHPVAVAEVMPSFNLPEPQQLGNPAECVTLDPEKSERAMLIQNAEGDWGIVKGHRVKTKGGTMSTLLSNAALVASLTVLSPLSTGTFSMSQLPSWKRTAASWTGLFSNASKMDLFGKQGVEVDMAKSLIYVGENCSNLPEFLAAVFSIWVE